MTKRARRLPLASALRRMAALPQGPLRILLFLAAVWWLLADPRPGGWIAGAVAVAFGAALHAVLGGGMRPRVRLRGLLSFLPFFALQSVRGGLDVSRRAFDPRLPLAPALLPYRMSLPEGPARAFFTSVVSLLPGTLAARVRGDELDVHHLAGGAGTVEILQELERRVGGLFLAPDRGNDR